jgi:hypothetical protein
MYDVSNAEVSFRGYPVRAMGDQCYELVRGMYDTTTTTAATILMKITAAMRDMAGHGEPADRMFRAEIGGVEIWMERASDQAWGEFWSVYVPAER